MSDETSPGPWQWVPIYAGEGNDFLVDATGARVLDINREWEPCDDTIKVSRADARLIAAAPEMLALLGEAMGWLEDSSDYAQNGGRDFDARVRALLKRIEGTK